MQNKRLENSVSNLINLYTVVIGVALTFAVTSVIDLKTGLDSIRAEPVLLFVAFLVTLFPFFHGALRHLEDAYIENDSSHIRTGAMLFDFGLLFLHALAFVILSQLIKHAPDFAWFLVCVLLIDIVWGIFVYFGSSSKKELSAESRWAIINFFFVATVIIYLVTNDITPKYVGDQVKLAVLLAVACTVRSACDYIWCRAFYFPNQ
jgi:hypothetical protein